MTDFFVTPQQFGAKGDGVSDDTSALRLALEAAQNGNGVLYFPRGTYVTGALSVPSGVTLKCEPLWSYRDEYKTALCPLSEDQECVLDLSDARGSTLYGLRIDGKNMGKNIHGLLIKRERGHHEIGEHCLRIETCQVKNFSGDGAHIEGGWAVSIRKSHFMSNSGYGVYFDATDGFIVDNWFSSNGKAGFGCDTWSSAVNFTSNRIEWNKECGLQLCGCMRYNVTGNYFDRSFGPAIVIKDAPNYHKRLQKNHTVIPYAITITGNNIVRSGAGAEHLSNDDCQIYMENAAGVVISANTFNVWKNDGPTGRVSPGRCIIFKSCSHCVISSNVMLPGAVDELICDLGGNGEGNVISGNTGAVIPEAARGIQDPFTPVHFMSEGGAPWYAEKLEGESNN